MGVYWKKDCIFAAEIKIFLAYEGWPIRLMEYDNYFGREREQMINRCKNA